VDTTGNALEWCLMLRRAANPRPSSLLPQAVPNANSDVEINNPAATVYLNSSIHVASVKFLAGGLLVTTNASTVQLNATSIHIASSASVSSEGSLALYANVFNISGSGRCSGRSLHVMNRAVTHGHVLPIVDPR
jgi:hypothetical protein